ncbi:hypothetical protein C0Q70_20569 [Pomacea canaliculata]|uniref:OCEL domain-containing protein n=1 Tax=Pomacea canaliculata TaxID=400727 RepID=A0A2T7NFZ2_POMCA|nr:hypothetical protein C0Q70_20569 [Pomacea canaliculata]
MGREMQLLPSPPAVGQRDDPDTPAAIIGDGCSRKPTIQFTGSTGVMRIPGQTSSHDPKAERQFQLSLTKILGDDNGSFDCIRQTATRPSGSSLQCQGTMQYKIVTHANNDVYTDTRKKITLADSELKKSCAKEIKMGGRFGSKKIKKVVSSSAYKSSNPVKAPSIAPRITPPTASSSSPVSSSAVSSRLTPPFGGNNHSPHRPNTLALNGNRPASKPFMSVNNGASKPSSHSSKQTSGVLSMPYRDRIIHILALRPYKKPELLARLMKDGIREKDKNSLGPILQQVGSMNKDNSYSLARHAWQDVRVDWAHYTEEERELVKKNLHRHESRMSISPSISPAARTPDSPSPPQKRPLEEVPDIPVKKVRISHEHQNSHVNGKVSNGMNGVVEASAVNALFNMTHKTNVLTGESKSRNGVSASSPVPESPSSNRENQEKGLDPNDTSSSPDYVTQYPSIEDGDQRMRYKQDFNEHYEEYRRLHEKVQNVARRFQYLRERISNTKEGTQDYEVRQDLMTALSFFPSIGLAGKD